MITVNVMFVTGQSESYQISNTKELLDLKEITACKMSYPVESTVLILRGKKLKGNKQLFEYGIENDCKLFWTPMVQIEIY